MRLYTIKLSVALFLGSATPLLAQVPPAQQQGGAGGQPDTAGRQIQAPIDPQLQQLLRQPGMGDQLRRQIQNSGLTIDQLKARLRSAGYPENLVDQYLGNGSQGVAAPAPSAEMIRAAAQLGLIDLTFSRDTSGGRPNRLVLTPADSFLIDSLGIDPLTDSLPTTFDSVGTMRLDTIAILKVAERMKRPRVFGLDVFRRASTEFSTIMSGPVDPQYPLGPGDELVVLLTGEAEQAWQLPVAREGTILVPQVGSVAVGGLTLEQARSLLRSRLGRVYAGLGTGPNARIRLEATLSRVRAIQVYVTGEVPRPGAYQISALGNALQALYQAGGPTARATFRNVQVMRGDSVRARIDLYDYLLNGIVRSNVRLEQGDVIFVAPRDRRITIEGSVLRPALYDVKEGEGLRDVVRMAGGLEPDAYTGRAQIVRILPPDLRMEGGRDRAVLDVALEDVMRPEAPAVPIFPEDRISVFPVTRPVRGQVSLRGNVWHGGRFALTPGMTVGDLLRTAGGLRPDTYLERAQILRLTPDSTRRMLTIDLTGMRPLGAPGDLSTDPGRPTADLALMEFDEVTVFSQSEFRPTRFVALYGEVQRPGLYPFIDSMTLRDAVLLAGGLRDNAYLTEAEVSRLPRERTVGTNAEVVKAPLDSTFIFETSGWEHRPVGRDVRPFYLQPYDNVFIRRTPGWETQRNIILTGQVMFPGRYTLQRQDERLADIIARAGGPTPTAYVQGFQLVRTRGRIGRIGLDLGRALSDQRSRDNMILVGGDSLHLPQYEPLVSVEGAVNSPVAVAFVAGRNAMFYVDRAGGMTRKADKKRTYVVQPNGSVELSGAKVLAGARVVVPEVPPDAPRTNWPQILATASALLTSALTVLVLATQL
jgi:polysaccharide export outer membrane protein